MMIGFELNPYDPCVANKIINGKQLTLVWQVEKLKIATLKKRWSHIWQNGCKKQTNIYSRTDLAR